MNKLKVIAFALIAAIILPVCAAGCSADGRSDIVILFTADVHCSFDGGIGYAGFAAYKKAMEKRTEYVVTVDRGDAVQGNYYGTVSNGAYAVEMMNVIGYDYAAVGNHEFDYGLERFGELVAASDAQYLACNIAYTGGGEDVLADIAAYEIAQYGDVSVGFVGIATPNSITSSAPTYFMEDGEIVYDFYGGENGERFYNRVQETVNECRAAGADYVVAIAHLGDSGSASPYTSTELIAATSGIDLLLDGHAHSTVPCRLVQNKSGESVPVSEAGTGLECFGQAVITANGLITVGLVTEYEDRDEEVSSYISALAQKLDNEMNAVVAGSSVDLISHENGIRIIRSRETNLGDFCADAYRMVSGADIGFMNGGGIRAELPAGNITYGDLIAVMPYGNTLCVAEATGQEILDALEFASRYTLADTEEGGNAAGECGGFLQVSGLKYTIDTSVQSTVAEDENGLFLSVEGERRVKDVYVLQDGEYVPIETDKTYTVACHNYMIKDCGDGFTMFADNELVVDEGVVDYQMLIDYISNFLGGSIGESYSAPDGRISVV